MAQEGKQHVQKKNEIRPTMQILCKVEGIPSVLTRRVNWAEMAIMSVEKQRI